MQNSVKQEAMIFNRPWILAILCASLMLLLLVACSGIIENGKAYSPDTNFRLQTQAILKGELALRQHPVQHEHDMVWTNDGLQQQWGLGVPIIRLPFEYFAKKLGFSHFPDRWVLLLFLLLSVTVLARGLMVVAATLTEIPLRVRQPLWLIMVFSVVFSPIVLAMLAGRLAVYEEAILYLLGFNWLQLGLLASLAGTRELRWLFIIAAVSGFAAFIRPTGALMALLTFLCGLGLLRSFYPDRFRGLLIPLCALFSIFPIILMFLNTLRFDHPMYFGQFMIMTPVAIHNFISDFGNPFYSESVFAALREMFGTLFQLEHLIGHDGQFTLYPNGLHAWEAATVRFREYKFVSYPLWMFFGSMLAWVLALKNWRQLSPVVKSLSLWSFSIFVLLYFFYSYSPAMASRYLVDFSPAIAIALVLMLINLSRYFYRYFDEQVLPHSLSLLPAVLFVGLLIWEGVDAVAKTPENYRGLNLPVSEEVMLANLNSRASDDLSVVLPESYECGDVRSNFGIPNNIVGWNAYALRPGVECMVSVATTVFLPEFECIELLTVDSPIRIGGLLRHHQTESIQVVVGSNRLENIHSEVIDENRFLSKFCVAQGAQLHRDYNRVVLAWVPPELVTHEAIAPLRFLRISSVAR